MPAQDTHNFRIVCLGGSAGGLRAYTDILRAMPPDTGIAFVVAPHRGLEYADLLREILAAVTTMPVREVQQNMTLQPNCVFIMPPRTEMSVAGNVFELRSIPAPSGWPQTISNFLYSLARSKGRRAVAVILSGLDHDGSAALKTIKDLGGITFAQSDASFNDMPKHAVETGHIDYFLPAEDIAEALRALAYKPHPQCDLL